MVYTFSAEVRRPNGQALSGGSRRRPSANRTLKKSVRGLFQPRSAEMISAPIPESFRFFNAAVIPSGRPGQGRLFSQQPAKAASKTLRRGESASIKPTTPTLIRGVELRYLPSVPEGNWQPSDGGSGAACLRYIAGSRQTRHPERQSPQCGAASSVQETGARTRPSLRFPFSTHQALTAWEPEPKGVRTECRKSSQGSTPSHPSSQNQRVEKRCSVSHPPRAWSLIREALQRSGEHFS
jgi:hypothetical protein